jgi:lysozyme
MNRERLRESIKGHEGLRLKPYRCTADKLTIGYGRNLEDRGISPAEAEYLLTHDLSRCEASARHAIPRFRELTAARQEVIVEMIFQLGLGGVLNFKRMIQAIRDNDMPLAGREMLDSKWAQRDTPERATELYQKWSRA